ncbi:MAG: 4-phosphopantetheinyl transferase, partial [Maribacter sp.]|nr:4-phosphopantetheinyl transferase [Maribacter sp.]
AYDNIKDSNDLVRKYTIVWGCKESLYKIYATLGLSFFKNIYIRDFEFSDEQIEGQIIHDGNTSSYELKYLEFEGFTCVYAVKV